MTTAMLDRNHIRVYEDILCGKLMPNLPRFAKTTEHLMLIREANTVLLLTSETKEKVQEAMEGVEYTFLGYKDQVDYDFDVRKLEGGRYNVSLFPVSCYELKELIDIPQLISAKSSAFGILITDQFERIKIRAEKFMDMDFPGDKSRAYAARHIHKAKKLFHDAKVLLKDLQAKQDGESFYVVFVLAIFLIRTILFYQKFFRLFLQEKPDSEALLKGELYDCVSLRQVSRMFKLKDTDYCEFLKKSYAEKTEVSERESSEYGDVEGKTFFQKKSQPANYDIPRYPKLQWNGQINVLCDVLLQLKEVEQISGKPLLGASYETLKNFIVANFCDKYGNDLSPHTIRTILQPQRVDKRLNPESSKKIDLSDSLGH